MQLNQFFQKLKIRHARLISRMSRNSLIELIRAGLKVSDHNSVLGALWSLLGPAAMLIILYLIFHGRFGQRVEVYPLYLLIGIICVNFIITATTYLIRVFSNNREFFLNTMVPKENLFLSELFIHAYKFFVELVVCAVICTVCAGMPWFAWLWMILLFAAYCVFVLGVSILLALLYTFARDAEHIWMIVSRFLYFITPVFYSVESLSNEARILVVGVNPLTTFLTAFRSIFLGQGTLQTGAVVYSLLIGTVSFMFVYLIFFCFEDMVMEHA